MCPMRQVAVYNLDAVLVDSPEALAFLGEDLLEQVEELFKVRPGGRGNHAPPPASGPRRSPPVSTPSTWAGASMGDPLV